MSVKRLLAVNTVSQLVGKAVSAGTALFMSVLIARQFGAAGYGDFTKITTFVAFFYLISDFGLNAVFLHQLKDGARQQNHKLWHALVSLRIIFSTFLIFCSFLIIALLPGSTTQGYTNLVKIGILIFSPTIFFQAIITSSNAIFQKNLRYDLSTVAVSIGSLVSLFLVWSATRASVSILHTISALLMGSIVTALCAIFFAIKLHDSWNFSFDIKKMRALFVSALPLAATLFFDLVYFRADSIILTLSRTTSEVGIYGFAYKIFEFPLVLPTFFMNSLYPLLLKKQNVYHLIKRSSVVLSLTSFVLLIFFWLAAPLFTFIKPEFAQSIPVFRILILGLPFFFLSSLTMWALIARGRQKILAGIYAIAMIINVSFNAVFVPVYGYTAAAWITVVSEGFVLALSSMALIKTNLTNETN